MDLLKQSETEYPYFRLARRIESFAWRSHYFEVSLRRALGLIFALDRKIEEAGILCPAVRVPPGMIALDTGIHWDYFVRYRQTISSCRDSEETEWVTPLSVGNCMEDDTPDPDEVLRDLSLAQSALLVKVLLMDLDEESVLLDDERESLAAAYRDPAMPGLRGGLLSFGRTMDTRRELTVQMIAEAEASGNVIEAQLLKDSDLVTPFERVRKYVRRELIPQADAVLSALSGGDGAPALP